MLLRSFLLTHPDTRAGTLIPTDEAQSPAEGRAGDAVAENTGPDFTSSRPEPGGTEEPAEPAVTGPAPPPREASPLASGT